MTSLKPNAKVTEQLEKATRLIVSRGLKMTALRHDVLALILSSERPLGAYDILHQLQNSHKGAAPPTVYRTLDFLQKQGLVHKIEKLAAFISCIHKEDPLTDTDTDTDAGHLHQHKIQFLLCTSCGHATELNSLVIEKTLSSVAQEQGFQYESAIVEIEGLCQSCLQEKKSHKKSSSTA
ncbi:Fur family transcriptional regulator [Entomobacter blattae]|uniref:Zinc uptake regulation protein n=1 Tax=Entomobacter blattae TaxID=2762277 RepID=A0A7H1NQC2_9PROT|nr:Fur family transcriptional regulator [Entomobacter blattae]QNT77982.1 Zinc uptake regulation protein [Entomobacter blattae]